MTRMGPPAYYKPVQAMEAGGIDLAALFQGFFAGWWNLQLAPRIQNQSPQRGELKMKPWNLTGARRDGETLAA